MPGARCVTGDLLQTAAVPERRAAQATFAAGAYPDGTHRSPRRTPRTEIRGSPPAEVYATLLEAGQTVTQAIDPDRYAWLQVARGTIRLNEMELKQGDGAAVSKESELAILAHDQAELLLFDLA